MAGIFVFFAEAALPEGRNTDEHVYIEMGPE